MVDQIGRKSEIKPGSSNAEKAGTTPNMHKNLVERQKSSGMPVEKDKRALGPATLPESALGTLRRNIHGSHSQFPGSSAHKQERSQEEDPFRHSTTLRTSYKSYDNTTASTSTYHEIHEKPAYSPKLAWIKIFNQEESRELPPIESGSKRHFAVADLHAERRIAGDIARALKDQSDSRLLRNLYQLQGEKSAIEKTRQVYAESYQRSLDEDIASHFQERPALQTYALTQLDPSHHNSISKDVQPQIYENEAIALHNAITQSQFDPQMVISIYYTLRSCKRDAETIGQIEETYAQRYNSDLRQRLQENLSAEALDHALFLLGDAQDEVQVISQQEATQLAEKILPTSTYINMYGEQRLIPFCSPEGGCYTRNYNMQKSLRELGYTVRNIYVISEDVEHDGNIEEENLRTNTPFSLAGDIDDIQPIAWKYHIATLLYVEKFPGNPDAGYDELVFDPSMSFKPLTIDSWLAMMNQQSYERYDLPTLKQKMAEEEAQENIRSSRYPLPGKTYIYTTDHTWPLPPENMNDLQIFESLNNYSFELLYKNGEFDDLPMMEDFEKYARKEEYHKLAWILRNVNQKICSFEDFVEGKIIKISEQTRLDFPNKYPQIYESFRKKLSASERARFAAYMHPQWATQRSSGSYPQPATPKNTRANSR